MKVESGILWGKGEYTCCNCSQKTRLHNETEILNPCQNCGCKEFIYEVSIHLSKNGLANKLSDLLTVLETGVFLYDICKLEEFLPIIAAKLRILLCDTQNNSIILKINDNFMIYPTTGNYLLLDKYSKTKSKIIMETDLFDVTKEKISLNDWLDQIIYSDETNLVYLSIREIIRTWADKNGGAHVDENRSEKNLYSIALFKEHLKAISLFIIKTFGNDWSTDIMDKIIKPIDNFRNAS